MGDVHYLFPASKPGRGNERVLGHADAEEPACGNHMAALLAPTNRSLVGATTLSSPFLVATLLRCDSGLSTCSCPIPTDKAFIVSVQLRALPFHELILHNTSVYSGYHRKGGVSALDLEDHPRFFFPSPFLCMQFYVKRSTMDALTDDYGVKPIQTLSWRHGAVDETVSPLALALLPVFQNPLASGNLFTDHVALALITHFAYAYGGMRAEAPPASDRLTPWQVRRCVKLLTEGLAEIDMVEQLAKACGLPASRFLVAFRQAIGESAFIRLATQSNGFATACPDRVDPFPLERRLPAPRLLKP